MVPVTIGSIFLGLALLLLLFLFLVRPFMKAPPEVEAVTKRQELETRKDAVLEAIRALDFDHDTGKMPDQEYEQQRSALMAEAAVTLKALDELPAATVDDDVYAQIEAAISRIKAQRTQIDGLPARFCTNCGQVLDSGDNFCARCGQPVFAVQPSS
jgi:rRNA maturation endonuclease Nob1